MGYGTSIFELGRKYKADGHRVCVDKDSPAMFLQNKGYHKQVRTQAEYNQLVDFYKVLFYQLEFKPCSIMLQQDFERIEGLHELTLVYVVEYFHPIIGISSSRILTEFPLPIFEQLFVKP